MDSSISKMPGSEFDLSLPGEKLNVMVGVGDGVGGGGRWILRVCWPASLGQLSEFQAQ